MFKDIASSLVFITDVATATGQLKGACILQSHGTTLNTSPGGGGGGRNCVYKLPCRWLGSANPQRRVFRVRPFARG